MLADMLVPIKLADLFENYAYQGIKKLFFSKCLVMKIQTVWKHHMEVFKARVQLFMACWRLYCLSIIESEKKTKNFTYTDFIYQIKEYPISS
jgi:hypothetical protein